MYRVMADGTNSLCGLIACRFPGARRPDLPAYGREWRSGRRDLSPALPRPAVYPMNMDPDSLAFQGPQPLPCAIFIGKRARKVSRVIVELAAFRYGVGVGEPCVDAARAAIVFCPPHHLGGLHPSIDRWPVLSQACVAPLDPAARRFSQRASEDYEEIVELPQ